MPYQEGFVSDPISNRRGTVYVIRYRIQTGDGKTRHKSETLYDVNGKKAAREVLKKRIQDASARPLEVAELTVKEFASSIWKAYLDRRGVKLSTRRSYECSLQRHVLPALGELLLTDVAPLHIENLVQTKLKKGLSAKSVRNLIGLLQGIFSLAVENDLIPRSPIRAKHKPVLQRREKPVWTPEQVKLILDGVPGVYRALFVTAALTGAR